ncbi:MAG: GNAT family N-acetyltransferase [Planctomycetota bacterium]
MSTFTIRPITSADDPAVAAVIRAVMPEFGADGPGFAIHDPEVAAMSAAYREELRAAYFVAVVDGRVIAGGGVGPLAGGDADICELKKMYALPEARGRGIGQALLDAALAAARTLGYRRCYLETLTGMDQAKRLYQKNGFAPICGSMGSTGHFGCDSFYLRDL